MPLPAVIRTEARGSDRGDTGAPNRADAGRLTGSQIVAGLREVVLPQAWLRRIHQVRALQASPTRSIDALACRERLTSSVTGKVTSAHVGAVGALSPRRERPGS